MKRFIIIITMLAYFSACSRNTTTTMIPLESVAPVACQPIHGVVLTDNQQVDFSPPDGRYVRKGKTVEGIVNGSDSISYRLDEIQTVLMTSRTCGDSVVAVPVDEFKSSHEKWDKFSKYRIAVAGKTNGRALRFMDESGRLTCDNFSLTGRLETGDSVTIGIDSVNVIKVGKAQGRSTSETVAITVAVLGLATFLLIMIDQEMKKPLFEWDTSDY